MNETTSPAPAGALLRRLPLIAIGIAAVLGAVLLRDSLGFDALRQHREALLAVRDANYPVAVAAFMAAYVVIVALSLPGATVATLTGGFLFGVFPGVIFNVQAAGTGATLIFLAARAGLGEILARRMDASAGPVRRIKAGIDANQWSFLFLMRLLPAVPFFVANLVPALIGVPLVPFAVTTYVGIIPGALIYTLVGAGLGEVFARGEMPDLGIIFQPAILLPILGICALVLLPVLVRTFRGRARHE